MELQSGKPWYRLHWLTIVLTGWLILTIFRCQLAVQDETAAYDPTGFESDYSFGWPLIHLEIWHVDSGSVSPMLPERRWNVRALAINCLTWPILVISTALVFERWLRARSRLQFGMHALLGLTGVTAALVAFLTQPTPQWVFSLGLEPSYGLMWCSIRKPFRWVMPLSVGCAIHTAGWLTYRLTVSAYSRIFRR